MPRSKRRAAAATPPGDATGEPLSETMRHLDSAIAKGRIPESIVAWRLFDSEVVTRLGRLLEGTVLQDLGYVDVTLYEEVARGYAQGAHPVLARITLPAGTRALAGFLLNDSDEGELLLPRGSWFRVLRAGRRDETGLLRVELELVP
jgi:hypothetical protein